MTDGPVCEQRWRDEAQKLAAQADISGATARLREALRLDPAVGITASNWNTLYWFGSLYGRAEDVLDACAKAISLADEASLAKVRDSRGLARVLTRNVQGAIEDFSSYIEWTKANTPDRYKRCGKECEQWVAALKAGQDPRQVFDAATLKELREE